MAAFFSVFFGKRIGRFSEGREGMEDVLRKPILGKRAMAIVGDLPGEIEAVGGDPSADELVHDGDLDFRRAPKGAGPGPFQIAGGERSVAQIEVDAADRF